MTEIFLGTYILAGVGIYLGLLLIAIVDETVMTPKDIKVSSIFVSIPVVLLWPLFVLFFAFLVFVFFWKGR